MKKERRNYSKTKILAIGDLHGNSNLAKKMAKKAVDEKVDLIIIPGDITWFNEEFRDVIKPFTETKKEILLLPGNHEPNSTIDMLTEIYPQAKNIHGNFFKKNDLGIFGAGYSSNLGPFQVRDEKMFENLSKSHEKIKDMKKKIMVTHEHHSGGKADKIGFRGSESIRKAIEIFKPDFLISGHIHELGGLHEKLGKTKIINVAKKGVIFEI